MELRVAKLVQICGVRRLIVCPGIATPCDQSMVGGAGGVVGASAAYHAAVVSDPQPGNATRQHLLTRANTAPGIGPSMSPATRRTARKIWQM